MHWIVVADSARARVFKADEMIAEVQELHALIHPASRLKAGEKLSDKQGRLAPGVGAEPHTDLKQVERQRFARDLAAVLEGGVGDYERLIVVAPPRFLGQLRKELGGPAKAKLTQTIAKDLTTIPGHEMAARVRGLLPDILGVT